MQLPVIDLKTFLETGNDAENCEKIANAFVNYGACLIEDPRITFNDNEVFLDLVTRYFDLPYEEKMKDARPDCGYQVGATPGYTEDPKCSRDPKCQTLIEKLEDQPTKWDGPDPKWRFFWRIGNCDSKKYPLLTAEPVIPESLKSEWPSKMNIWGNLLVDTGMVISEMAALGLGYERNAFLDYTKGGPHLLAPTGSDLHNAKIGDVFAGFHYDLNFVTIHGKSHYPGLNIWARNSGKKLAVKVPKGMLIVQAGKQFEYVTNGKVVAGYHEVVVNEGTLNAVEVAKSAGRGLWRVSSTVFIHAHPDKVLRPIKAEDNPQYPAVDVGKYVQNELQGIALMEK